MQSITVNKSELQAILEKNRAAHRAIFEEAIDNYRIKVIERLEEMIGMAKKNKQIETYVSLKQPEDHTRDYDRVIGMLKLAQEQEIKLDETTFAYYVLDDWQWKRQFLTTNSYYSATAARELDSAGDDDD